MRLFWRAVLALGLWLGATGAVLASELIDYPAFKRLVREGRIADVTLSSDRLEGQLNNGSGRRVATRPVPDPELVSLLESRRIPFRAAPAEGHWLIWLIPAATLLLIWALWNGRQPANANGLQRFGQTRARPLVGAERPNVRFADVAGVPEAKAELAEIVDFLADPHRYADLGGRLPKGVLLAGPPGTGKTMLAKAVAAEADVSFFALSGSEFVELFVGVGASRVRDLFRQAREKAPCVVFIDELDALGRVRAGNPLALNEERDQTLNQLLAEMDGFTGTEGIMVLAATNRPEVLDPALLRPGRFDRRVVVERPDQVGREAILKVHAARLRLASDVALGQLARQTIGMSGAELANLLNEAALLAGRHHRPQVTMADCEAALERLVGGLERPHLVLNPAERLRVSLHEAGHAVAACLLPGADPVVRVSLVPRGLGLGFTWQAPACDRQLQTRSELLDKAGVLLAGRAAELLTLGEPSTGAADDLQRATSLLRQMVAQAGLSETLGPQAYATEGTTTGPCYSEATARRIDAEVQALLETTAARIAGLLAEHVGVLCETARLLRECEYLDGERIRALLPARASRAA